MSIGPILATAPWVSAEQHAEATAFARDIVRDSFQCSGARWYPVRFACCHVAMYYAPEPPPLTMDDLQDPPPRYAHDVPRCPVCEPWAYLEHRSPADRVRLVKALADTDTMMVALDAAQHGGRTSVSDLRNPADVLRIEALEREGPAFVVFNGRHACVASSDAALGWLRVPTPMLDQQAHGARPRFTVHASARVRMSGRPWDEYRPWESRAVILRGRYVSGDTRSGVRIVWIEPTYERDAEAHLEAIAAMA